MKDEQIRIAVAELRGWHSIENSGILGFPWSGYPPKDYIIGKKKQLPNYLNDANECVKLLESIKFAEGLTIELGVGDWYFSTHKHLAYGSFCRAACEIYLKVNNKWKEDND